MDVLADSLSGKDTNRPALQRMLAMLVGGEADGVLVTKLDRLTRSVRDGEELIEKYFNGRFILLSLAGSIDTRSAYGRLVIRVMLVFAQFEREVIAERTKDGLEHVRAMGGGTPRVEGPAAARILELAERGLSLRAIGAQLRAEGLQTLKGGTWGPETIRKVLSRARAA